MYKREFLNLLRANTLPRALLLYGVCDFQIEHYAKEVMKSWAFTQSDGLIFYFDEYDFNLAKNHLLQSSLFGGKNFLHIKSDKVLNKEQIEKLISLTMNSDQNYLLISLNADDSKTKSFANLFNKKGGATNVRFFKLLAPEAISYLSFYAKELKINISKYALSHLYATHNENLPLSISELEKLALLDKEVTTKDIDALIYGMGEVELEEFIENLLKGKISALSIKNILEAGEVDEIRLINMIQNHLFMLFNFHAYIKLHGRCDPKEIVGYAMPSFIADKKAKESMSLKIENYTKILSLLAQTEHALKSNSKEDKPALLISTLLKISKLIEN
ncbi:MAG: DNA polymerase III subunit delta [Sulfurospirillaceae bacterium]|nr:DNA polymerase III subunit delta [Sulfurospirillaceae bacterium]MCK9546673.1 DNA polymerase III subunit delta [Sulfurospirillaceae bacterium]MDY0237771.1 DNA polymerase III subunit delta [Campylobacterales bacterium]